MDKRIYSRKAAYYETDQMRIVHHSNYIRYFEDARISFMSDIGCDVGVMEEQGLYIPNVDAYARYKKPIKFYDEFTVEARLISFNGSRMVFEYKIVLCQSGDVAATGKTTHCFATKDLKPVSIRHSYPDYYKRMKDNIDI